MKYNSHTLLSAISREHALLWYAGFMFLFLEVVLFAGLRFTTTYLYAHLIIALGILGLLVGGVFAHRVRDEHVQKNLNHTLLFIAATPVLGFLGVIIAASHVWASVVLFALVFIPFGLLIGLLYRTVDPHTAYAHELFGAVLGVVCAAVFLSIFREENALISAFVIGVGVFAAWSWRTIHVPKKILVLAVFLLGSALLYNNLLYDRLNLINLAWCGDTHNTTEREGLRPPSKIFCDLKQWSVGDRYDIVLSRGGLTDRIDIVHIEGQEKYLTAFSGEQTDVIQPYEPRDYINDARIPTTFFDDPSVLVIGMGAEGIGKVAKQAGASEMVAVELNPIIADIWRSDKELIAYSKGAYEGAQVHNADGRTYLENTSQRFDLITMMNTHRARNAGSFGEPDFLHTKESFKQIFSHLTHEGIFIFEEPNFFNEADEPIQNIVATLVRALKESEVEDPKNHILAYTWVGAPAGDDRLLESPFFYVHVLVKRTPFTEGDKAKLFSWSEQSRNATGRVKENNMLFYSWVWPDVSTSTSEHSFTSELTGLIEGSSSMPTAILTDHNPFPAPVPVTSALLWTGAAIFIAFLGMGWWHARYDGRFFRTRFVLSLYFILIGLGYAAAEVLLLQWFNLYLGSVPVSFVVTLGGMLTASGLVSIYTKEHIRHLPRVLVWCVALLGLSLMGVLSVPDVWYPSEFFVRLGIALVVSGIVGAVLGLFFPRVLALAKESEGHSITLLVVQNGSALAVGFPLAFFLSSIGGFYTLVAGVIALYGCAAVLFLLIKDKL